MLLKVLIGWVLVFYGYLTEATFLVKYSTYEKTDVANSSGFWLMEPFLVKNPLKTCTLACHNNINCRFVTLNTTNFCTLYDNQVSLNGTIYSPNTKILANKELTGCAANYYQDFDQRVCRYQKTYGQRCKTSIECLTVIGLGCVNGSCECSINQNQFWLPRSNSCVNKKGIGECESSIECIYECLHGFCQIYFGMNQIDQLTYIYQPPGYPNLQRYWPFGGSVRDVISGNDMTLYINQSPEVYHFTSAKIGLNLNIDYAISPIGVFNCTTGFTVSFRLNLLESPNETDILYFSSPYMHESLNWPFLKFFNLTENLNVFNFYTAQFDFNKNTSFFYINGTKAGNISVPSAIELACNQSLSKTLNYVLTIKPLNAFIFNLKIFNKILSQKEIWTELSYGIPYALYHAKVANLYKPPVAYTNGLINYWPFTNSTVDIVGGSNLTIQQNAYFVSDRFDNYKSALYFNLGYATAPPGVYFDCTAGYTVMNWIKLMATGYNPRILQFSNGELIDNVAFYLQDTNLCFTSSNVNNTNWNPVVTSSTQLTLGVWAHVAATVSLTDTTLYINGRQVATDANGTCKNGTMRSTCKIGQSDNPQVTYLVGIIDELKIFNRVLSQPEIAAEMNVLEPYQKLYF